MDNDAIVVYFHGETNPATGRPYAAYSDVPARDLTERDVRRIDPKRLDEILAGPPNGAPLYSRDAKAPDGLNPRGTYTVDGMHGEPSPADIEGHFAIRRERGEDIDDRAVADAYESAGMRERAAALRFAVRERDAKARDEKRAAARKGKAKQDDAPKDGGDK